MVVADYTDKINSRFFEVAFLCLNIILLLLRRQLFKFVKEVVHNRFII